MVEITESVAMRDPACVEPVLEDLRRLGVRLAIDDFGTGHSSLARLRDLEVDVLKIDRGFLRRAPEDERADRLLARRSTSSARWRCSRSPRASRPRSSARSSPTAAARSPRASTSRGRCPAEAATELLRRALAPS